MTDEIELTRTLGGGSAFEQLQKTADFLEEGLLEDIHSIELRTEDTVFTGQGAHSAQNWKLIVRGTRKHGP